MIREHFAASREVMQKTAEREHAAIERAAALISQAFKNGGKLLLCGNGGSAADAQHMAAELVSRLRREVERPPLPAIALTTDTSFLTAFANDCGFEGVFERQVNAHGRPGDALIGISTSGRSPNVLKAFGAAKRIGFVTVGLFGECEVEGNLVDCPIRVPSRNTQHIQETLLAVEHIICQRIEETLFGEVKP